MDVQTMTLIIACIASFVFGLSVKDVFFKSTDVPISEVFRRIVKSKKAILGMIPVISTGIAQLTGFDPTNYFNLAVAVFGWGYFVVQSVLDMIRGSASDGTAIRPAGLEEVEKYKKAIAEALARLDEIKNQSPKPYGPK